jgi:hypothetical protein
VSATVSVTGSDNGFAAGSIGSTASRGPLKFRSVSASHAGGQQSAVVRDGTRTKASSVVLTWAPLIQLAHFLPALCVQSLGTRTIANLKLFHF